MKRRDFLKFGAKVGVATTALPVMLGGFPLRVLGKSPLRSLLASGAVGNDKILVIIQLAGGNDGLNCVVPYADPLYTQYRPSLGLDKTADGLLVLSDHDTIAFTKEMSGMHDLYGAGKMALLQNVGYPNPDLSHFRGTDIWNTSTDSNIFANTGWVGRMLEILNPDYPPSTIAEGSFPLALQFGASLSNAFFAENGGMGIVIGQLPEDGAASTHLYDAIPANPTVPYQELDYVRTIEKETEVYSRSIVNRKVTLNKATYPTNSKLSPQLSGVAQLIASGFTTKIYLVTQSGYDTHSNQATDQPNLLSDLSASIKAFQDDIEALGVADKVAIMTYSEFGRRPVENGSGTDHGTAAPHFVIGTQVIPGVRGSDPKLGQSDLVAGNLAYDTRHDFRNVYATMMYEWLLDGADADKDTLIDSVLTSSNGHTFSTTSDWIKLGIFKDQASGVNNADFIPGLMLVENYPNPAQNSTTIDYAIPDNMDVELGIFNSQGIEIARIVEEKQTIGAHSVLVNTSKFPSGNYIYRLKTAKGEVAKRMVVVK
jgi:uncharacterized protein (DUF1501 family)